MIGGHLVQNRRNAESSLESFLNCFCCALSDHLPEISTILPWALNTGLTVHFITAPNYVSEVKRQDCLQGVGENSRHITLAVPARPELSGLSVSHENASTLCNFFWSLTYFTLLLQYVSIGRIDPSSFGKLLAHVTVLVSSACALEFVNVQNENCKPQWLIWQVVN